MGNLRTLSLALVLLTSGGCGTIINLGGTFGTGKVYPYGGVLLDGVGIAGSAGTLETGQLSSDIIQTIPLSVLATVDLPFSIVGDTLTLPWTIRYFANLKEIWQDNRKKPEEEPKKIE